MSRNIFGFDDRVVRIADEGCPFCSRFFFSIFSLSFFFSFFFTKKSQRRSGVEAQILRQWTVNAIPASSCVSAREVPSNNRSSIVPSRYTRVRPIPRLHPPRVSSGVICTYQLRLSIPKGPPHGRTVTSLSISPTPMIQLCANIKTYMNVLQPCVPHLYNYISLGTIIFYRRKITITLRMMTSK